MLSLLSKLFGSKKAEAPKQEETVATPPKVEVTTELWSAPKAPKKKPAARTVVAKTPKAPAKAPAKASAKKPAVKKASTKAK